MIAFLCVMILIAAVIDLALWARETLKKPRR